MSLGKKNECLTVKPLDWDPGDPSLISVFAAGIQGGLRQDTLPFCASVLHLNESLQRPSCSEHKLQSFLKESWKSRKGWEILWTLFSFLEQRGLIANLKD